MKEIWIVAYSDCYFDDCYNGKYAFFSTEEKARDFFEETKAKLKKDMADKVYYVEDKWTCDCYDDEEHSEVRFNLSVFPKELDQKFWFGLLDW